MKKILLILVLISVISCKNEPKEEAKNSNPENVVESTKELEVIVNFKTNKEDEFKLMLNNVKVDEFQRKNIHIMEKVVPTSGIETITANFGENNMSTVFYFNLGNKEPKEVEIESLSFKYGEKSISISPDQLEEYFAFNKFVTLDSVSHIFKTSKIDGQHYPNLIFKRKHLVALAKK